MESGDRGSLLLVEDEAIIAAATRLGLVGLGYRVLLASSGEAALAKVQAEGDIRLVLMDVDLGPGMSGPEAAAAILGVRELPVVFLSSHTEPEVVAMTEDVGSYGYVVKSSGLTVLEASIKMALRLFEAKRERERSEANYRNLFRHMLDGAALHELIFDAEGKAVDYRILDVNRAFESLLGIPRERAVGKTARELYGTEAAPYLDIYAAVAERDEHALFETYFPAMDKHFSISAYRSSPGRFATIFEDVSERKRAERALREAESLREQILLGAEEGLVVYGPDLRYKAWNPFMERISGYPAEAVLGHHPSEFFPSLAEAGVLARLERILAGGGPEHSEFEYRVPASGKRGWASDTSIPLRDEEGRIAGVIGVIHDISEHKLLLAESREREERLELALEAAEAGTWEWELATGANIWSEDLWRLYGLSPEEASPSYEAWLSTVEPADRDRVTGILRAAVEARGELRFEWRVATARGEGRWLMSRGKPQFGPEGELRGYIGVVIDITDRVRVEESDRRFRLAVEVAPFPIMLHAEDGEVIALSRTWTELSGYSREDIPTIASWTARAYGEKAGEVAELIGTQYSLERRKAEGEFLVRCADGGERVWDFSSVALGAMDDGRRLAMSMAFDLTERRRDAERIRGLLAEKELILREVHHRLKNNMGAIAGFLFLQAEEAGDESSRAALRDAYGRIQSMLILYDKLYKSTDYLDLAISDYLPALVDQVVGNYPIGSRLLVERAIENFRLDARRLQPLGIIVNELLTNALKYAFAGRGGGRLSVQAGVREGRAFVAIGDDGVGMPDSVNFERPASFGLRLVRGLAEQLDGGLRLERGAGTRIVLEFRL